MQVSYVREWIYNANQSELEYWRILMKKERGKEVAVQFLSIDISSILQIHQPVLPRCSVFDEAKELVTTSQHLHLTLQYFPKIK